MIYVLLLIGIEIFLFLKNYIPNTYLIGWDNLMPEFNIWLNLKRSLFSVWQEYRGLGIYDGMAHASNLMHTIYIFLLHFCFTDNILRYAFIFLTHLLGGIGFFYLAKKIIKNKNAAFLGALLYMFNLGVIQIYSAPLEVFSTHFVALPFLILSTINALDKPDKKNILFLFIASILTTPQSFVPTIFVAFFILFFFILLFHYLQSKNLKSVITVFSVIIIANLFWLIPFVYNVKNNAKIIQNARINQYSSEEIYLKNYAFGNLTNVLSFKGFMMDGMELNNKTNQNEYLMGVWREYTKTPLFIIVFLSISAIALFGVIRTLKDRNSNLLPYLITISIAFFFLANRAPLFEQLNNLFRYIFPTLAEAFRFPFTKFIILFTFCYSILFAYGLSFLLQKTEKYRKIIILLTLFLIAYISYPAFQGNFISRFMKQAIPNDYFNSIDKNKRIAFLPTPSFWNWDNRKWGQRGSGFLWYGIPQPIMLRAFDPWSNFDEQFYNEFSYAQKQDNVELFNQVLKKYNIDYLLLDTSIINNISSKAINYDQLESFLDKNTLLVKDQQFGVIIIYKVNQPTHTQFISLLNDPVHVSTQSSYYYEDTAYKKFGNYISDSQNPDQINPLSALFTEKTQNDLEFTAQEQDNSIVFTPKNNLFSRLVKEGYYNLTIPSILNTYLIPAQVVNDGGKAIIKIIQPAVVIDNTEYNPADAMIEINPQIIGNPISFKLTESNQSFKLGDTFYLMKDYPNTLKITDNNGNSQLTQVNLANITAVLSMIKVLIKPNSIIQLKIPKIKSDFSFDHLIENGKYSVVGNKNDVTKYDGVDISTAKDKIEIAIYKDNLPHQSGYIFFTKTSWSTGLPMDFYVDNPSVGRSELETKISTEKDFTNIIILPPTQNVYSGYGLHFVADPIGNQRMETKIQSLSFYPVPWEVLTGINLTKDNMAIAKNLPITTGLQVNKTIPYLYEVNLGKISLGQNNKVLTLSQAFHNGWKAYEINGFNFINVNFPFFFGKELKDQVLINNWANGWKLDDKACNTLAPRSSQSEVGKHETCNIVIIFWPQYLEFIGFGLLIGTLLGIVFYKHRKRVV